MNVEPKKPDLSEQLAKLAKLHADGSLSDEEFVAFRAKLIRDYKGSSQAKNGFDEREGEAEISEFVHNTYDDDVAVDGAEHVEKILNSENAASPRRRGRKTAIRAAVIGASVVAGGWA